MSRQLIQEKRRRDGLGLDVFSTISIVQRTRGIPLYGISLSSTSYPEIRLFSTHIKLQVCGIHTNHKNSTVRYRKLSSLVRITVHATPHRCAGGNRCLAAYFASDFKLCIGLLNCFDTKRCSRWTWNLIK